MGVDDVAGLGGVYEQEDFGDAACGGEVDVIGSSPLESAVQAFGEEGVEGYLVGEVVRRDDCSRGAGTPRLVQGSEFGFGSGVLVAGDEVGNGGDAVARDNCSMS